MSCPFLRRAHPLQCRAVAVPARVDREISATFCRGRFDSCAAYRYVRAAGRPLNPADFQAWVVDRLSPGRVDPAPAGAADAPDTG